MTKWAYFRYAKLVQKLVNVINHINRLRGKIINISTDIEKAFDKI